MEHRIQVQGLEENMFAAQCPVKVVFAVIFAWHYVTEAIIVKRANKKQERKRASVKRR